MRGTPRDHADRLGTTVERLIEAIAASGHTWHDFANWVEFCEIDDSGSVWMVGDAMPEWLADYLPAGPAADDAAPCNEARPSLAERPGPMTRDNPEACRPAGSQHGGEPMRPHNLTAGGCSKPTDCSAIHARA